MRSSNRKFLSYVPSMLLRRPQERRVRARLHIKKTDTHFSKSRGDRRGAVLREWKRNVAGDFRNCFGHSYKRWFSLVFDPRLNDLRGKFRSVRCGQGRLLLSNFLMDFGIQNEKICFSRHLKQNKPPKSSVVSALSVLHRMSSGWLEQYHFYSYNCSFQAAVTMGCLPEQWLGFTAKAWTPIGQTKLWVHVCLHRIWNELGMDTTYDSASFIVLCIESSNE